MGGGGVGGGGMGREIDDIKLCLPILAPGGWERELKTKITYEVVENAFHSTLPEASETVRWSPFQSKWRQLQ